jgi:hypothetical protein
MKKIFILILAAALISSCTSFHYNCNSSSKNPKCNTKVRVGVPDINIEID